MAEAALDIFGPVLPITDSVMRRMTDLVITYEELAARDLVHVATCADANVDMILSPDRGFDAVDRLARVDPMDAAELL